MNSVLEHLRLPLSQAALKCIKRALVELLFQQSSLRETEALALKLDGFNNAKSMAYCSAAKHVHPAALDAVVTTLGIPRLSEFPLSNRNAGSLQIHFCFLGCLNVSADAVLPRIH